jgi:UDP-N-acetylmuramoylalanine--D-glutamate ligase
MLACENQDVDWWVIELSSYQISDLEAQPDIAVLLNLSEEHLDWHRGLEHYREDKLKLAKLAAGGRIIANFSDRVLTESLKSFRNLTWFNQTGNWQAGKDHVFRLQERTGQQGDAAQSASSVNQCQIAAPASLPGAHNMHNLAAALTVVETLGLDIPQIDEVLRSFTGLPHRLQFVGEKAGVRYINDSISTTPVSVAAALQTIGSANVVLLLGGLDRGLDWSDFAATLPNCTPYAIITMPDNGPKVFDCLQHAGVEPPGGLHAVTGLQEALLLAQTLVPENGCILLSPGAPSFPHFRDFEDRGNQFKKFAGF